jgi:hypothetical protein
MNWEVASTIAEIIASIAVVVSVAYLAIQIRGQTRQAKLAASRELAIAWTSTADRLIDNQEFVTLYLRSAADYESLPNAERFRISMFLLQSMRLREQSFLHVQKGNLDPTHFESTDRILVEALRLPGVQQWWAINREHFCEEFMVYVDGRMELAKGSGYSSSFKAEREKS